MIQMSSSNSENAFKPAIVSMATRYISEDGNMKCPCCAVFGGSSNVNEYLIPSLYQ